MSGQLYQNNGLSGHLAISDLQPAGATLHGGDNHFALPAQETAKNSLDLKDRMALNLKNQNVFLRIERNFYHHMTLQQKPTDFDVLVQIYEKRCAESIDGQEEIAPLGEARLCNLKDASATDLTQKATLWTLQEIKIDPLDDSDAGDLLLQMAEAKAWGSRVQLCPGWFFKLHFFFYSRARSRCWCG